LKKDPLMQKYYLSPTTTTPEIHFSPEENIFLIRGTSSPEDVRAIYYPVIEWISSFIEETVNKADASYSADKPLVLMIDLLYFNSSSAKFLYDIIMEFKKLHPVNIPVEIEWYYDRDDLDLKEAGTDIASLAEMEFVFIPKTTDS
jgi:hypothetical protein